MATQQREQLPLFYLLLSAVDLQVSFVGKLGYLAEEFTVPEGSYVAVSVSTTHAVVVAVSDDQVIACIGRDAHGVFPVRVGTKGSVSAKDPPSGLDTDNVFLVRKVHLHLHHQLILAVRTVTIVRIGISVAAGVVAADFGCLVSLIAAVSQEHFVAAPECGVALDFRAIHVNGIVSAQDQAIAATIGDGELVTGIGQLQTQWMDGELLIGVFRFAKEHLIGSGILQHGSGLVPPIIGSDVQFHEIHVCTARHLHWSRRRNE